MKKLLCQKGVAAVEFAIVLVPLIILILGAVELGLVLYNQQVLTNASREAARAGIVSQVPRVDDATIQQVVKNYSLNRLITFGAGTLPLTNVTRTGKAFGDELTVTVSYNYDFLIVPKFVPVLNPLKLKARTVMRYE